VRAWQDGCCNNCRRRKPTLTSLLLLLLLLLLFDWQRENPTDLDARRLSSATNATSSLLAPPPPQPALRLAAESESLSTTAKNTLSCVCAFGGVQCSARARRHLVSDLPNVLEQRR
jgi:hypothetical protein